MPGNGREPKNHRRRRSSENAILEMQRHDTHYPELRLMLSSATVAPTSRKVQEVCRAWRTRDMPCRVHTTEKR